MKRNINIDLAIFAKSWQVAGLKSLANHWSRLYHIHKVWCGDVDKNLIEYSKA